MFEICKISQHFDFLIPLEMLFPEQSVSFVLSCAAQKSLLYWQLRYYYDDGLPIYMRSINFTYKNKMRAKIGMVAHFSSF